MANLIRSIGYSLGKVHAGMISYLCELYREGNQEPFESFLTTLGVSVPSNPVPWREWHSVDLAILEQAQDGKMVPQILIELKVDDYETGTSQETYQTVRYASQWPSCQAYLFITLGKGEYYHAPRSNRFTWVRIRKFLKALEAINTKDRFISDWIEEIKHEILLQDNVLIADKSRIAAEHRAGTWNIYLFGRLAEMLVPEFKENKVDINMTCYTYGTRPDTIFNFGWSKEPLYIEINYNGRLNLKISLDTSESEDVRREIINQQIIECKQLPFSITPTLHPCGKIKGSKTIASFDVGLIPNEDGNLECQPSIDVVKQRIYSVVNTFYGRKPSGT